MINYKVLFLTTRGSNMKQFPSLLQVVYFIQ